MNIGQILKIGHEDGFVHTPLTFRNVLHPMSEYSYRNLKNELCLYDALIAYPICIVSFAFILGSSRRELNLNRNMIGNVGAASLAKAFPTMPNLEALGLNSNQIGDEGAEALARGLASLPNLQHLHLDSNQIGDGGVEALAKVFHSLPELRQLWLSYNNIGDVGAQGMAKALPNIPKLENFQIQDNKITEAGRKKLQANQPPNFSIFHC